jgi:hypothetical protein
LFVRQFFISADKEMLTFRNFGALSTRYSWSQIESIQLVPKCADGRPIDFLVLHTKSGDRGSAIRLLHFPLSAEEIVSRLRVLAPSEVDFLPESQA